MFSGWRGVHRASSAIAGSSAVLGEDGLSVRTYTGNFCYSHLDEAEEPWGATRGLRGRRTRARTVPTFKGSRRLVSRGWEGVKGPRHARPGLIVERPPWTRHRSLAGCHAGCPEAHIWYVRTRPVEERVSSLSSTASSGASLGISHLLRLCAASVQLFLSALPAAARAG